MAASARAKRAAGDGPAQDLPQRGRGSAGRGRGRQGDPPQADVAPPEMLQSRRARNPRDTPDRSDEGADLAFD